jgi:hypothetical protein
MHKFGLLISPPTGLHGNSTVAAVVLTATVVTLAAVAGWGVARRRWLLIALLAGGFLAGFVESQLDLLSRIWWAANLPRAYETFGRPIPLIVPFTYSLVIGGGAYLAYALCARGCSRRTLIRFGIAFSILEPIFEMILMTTHFYRYYGPQPFRVFGYPLYWGPINGVGATSAGVFVYLWRDRFVGRNAAFGILVVPIAFGMDFAFGWPLFDVMNTHASQLTMSLVSLLPMALCAGELWLVSSYIGESTHHPPSDADPGAGAEIPRPADVITPVPAGVGA